MNKLLCAGLLALPCLLSAQTIVRKGHFNANNLGTCKDGGAILMTRINPDGTELEVYTWNGLTGTVNAQGGAAPEKAAKTKGGGALMRRLEAAAVAGVTPPSAPIPDAGMISVRRLSIDVLMKWPNFTPDEKGFKAYGDYFKKNPSWMDVKNFLLYPKEMSAGATYTFSPNSSETCGQANVKYADMKMESIEAIAEKLPALDINKTGNRAYLYSKGDGIADKKNVKSYIVANDYVRTLDKDAVALKAVMVKENKIDVTQLNGFRVLNARDVQLHLEDGRHFAIAHNDDQDDKWSYYRSFKLVQYNRDGITQVGPEIKPPYLKNVSVFTFTYDQAGQPEGILLMLSNFANTSKEKDPKDNNHFLYYFDLNGKEIFTRELEHGNPKNSRGFDPILVTGDGQKLRMLNINWEKALAPNYEILEIGASGEAASQEFTQKRAGSTIFVSELGMLQPQQVANGVMMLTRSTVQKKDLATNSINKGEAIVAMITTDFRLLGGYKFENPTENEPAIQYLGKVGDKQIAAVSIAGKNHFLTFGAPESLLSLPLKEDTGLNIPAGALEPNFVLSPATGMMYAYYTLNGLNHSNALGYMYVVDMK